MMELRIRACHVTGEFTAKDNRRADFSGKNRIAGPPRFQYGRLAHPPVIFSQERLKVEERLPAAQQFIRERKLNEVIPGDLDDVGIIVIGGLTNGVLRALARLDLADLYGACRIPIYVLNVAYPLVPEELRDVLRGQAGGAGGRGRQPRLHRAGGQRRAAPRRHPDPRARQGPLAARRRIRVRGAAQRACRLPRRSAAARHRCRRDRGAREEHARRTRRPRSPRSATLPPRPPNFCTGCPERPVFTAIKLMQRELGPTHISADIGCHSFATFAPFSLGNSILGYGMSLASAAAVTPNMDRRPIAIMGDGGFWHNGLITGVASNLFNKGDGVLIVMQNGYASATGQQYLPSSAANRIGSPTGMTIEQTLRSLGRQMAAHGAQLQRRQDGQDA